MAASGKSVCTDVQMAKVFHSGGEEWNSLVRLCKKNNMFCVDRRSETLCQGEQSALTESLAEGCYPEVVDNYGMRNSCKISDLGP